VRRVFCLVTRRIRAAQPAHRRKIKIAESKQPKFMPGKVCAIR
jgi:hypothetical protein